MLAKIVRLDKSISLPNYKTKESAGFDIESAEDHLIKPGQVVPVGTGLIVQAPEGHFLLIASRSSLSIKKGLILSNGIGVIDRDYCGPEDEIKILLHNITNLPVTISKGERIAQGLFMPVDQVQWVETENIASDSRGGLGSTGGYK